MTEGPVIVQMIADQATAKALAPTHGSSVRYKLLEWPNFLTSEVHKSLVPCSHGTSQMTHPAFSFPE